MLLLRGVVLLHSSSEKSLHSLRPAHCPIIIAFLVKRFEVVGHAPKKFKLIAELLVSVVDFFGVLILSYGVALVSNNVALLVAVSFNSVLLAVVSFAVLKLNVLVTVKAHQPGRALRHHVLYVVKNLQFEPVIAVKICTERT